MIIQYLRVDIQYKKHFPTFVHLAHAQLLNQTARQPFWSSSPLLNSTTAYFLCQAIEPVKFSLSNLLIHRPCCVDKMDESRSDPKLKFFRRHFLCPQGGKKSQGQGKHGVLCYSKLRDESDGANTFFMECLVTSPKVFGLFYLATNQTSGWKVLQ